jgi:hypothetical protein
MEMDGMENADEEPQDLDNDSPEMRELRLHMPTASTNANDLLMAHRTVSHHPSLIQWNLPDLIYRLHLT